MTEYFIEDGQPLKNKLGIDDLALLKEAEAYIVSVRLAELQIKPVRGRFDFKHLKAIHKHLFSDIYTMAGKVRSVDIAKDGSVFCYVQNIENMQKEIFDRLRAERLFQSLDKKQFAQKLAQLTGDLIALHPFREGNGRATRCFLRQLAIEAGYELLFEDAEISERLTADIRAFHGDIQPLTSLYDLSDSNSKLFYRL